jgi:hypothetical protein
MSTACPDGISSGLRLENCLLFIAPSCLGVRAARCVVAQGAPVERGAADWEVTGSHTHAWEWQAHACVASRLLESFHARVARR